MYSSGASKKPKTQTMVTWWLPIHKANLLSVCLTVVSSARIRVLYFKVLSSPVCLSSFPPAHSLADRSEVADQAGRLCAWCNSFPSRQAASCDLLGNFALLPKTLSSTPGLLHRPLPMLGSKGDTGGHVSMATCKMACVYCSLLNVRVWLVCWAGAPALCGICI